MHTETVPSDIQVMYITATSFPEGVALAHEQLHSVVTPSEERRYFGISWPIDGVIVYKAAAEIVTSDEAETLALETFTIKKGTYNVITIKNYAEDLTQIGRAFDTLTSQENIDPNGYCLEWYYNDTDVHCMVPTA